MTMNHMQPLHAEMQEAVIHVHGSLPHAKHIIAEVLGDRGRIIDASNNATLVIRATSNAIEEIITWGNQLRDNAM